MRLWHCQVKYVKILKLMVTRLYVRQFQNCQGTPDTVLAQEPVRGPAVHKKAVLKSDHVSFSLSQRDGNKACGFNHRKIKNYPSVLKRRGYPGFNSVYCEISFSFLRPFRTKAIYI